MTAKRGLPGGGSPHKNFSIILAATRQVNTACANDMFDVTNDVFPLVLLFDF